MNSRKLLPLIVLALASCQDKKPEPSAQVAVAVPTAGGDTETPEPRAAAAPKCDPAKLKDRVSGAIKGKPFIPDNVVYEAGYLSFRKGKNFFADMELEIKLPPSDNPKLEGKTWTHLGEMRDYPAIRLAEVKSGSGVPKSDYVKVGGFALTLKITKQTPRTLEGTIDLRIDRPADTHLVGSFTAAIKPLSSDPVDAADAPAISGKIAMPTGWKEEKIRVGYFSVLGEKPLGNSNESLFKAGQGGGGTTLSHEPQNTSSFNGAKTGVGYKHVGMSPGEFVVYVCRNGVVADYKKVSLKEKDLLTVDLAIDPAKAGRAVATLSDTEAIGQFDLESFYLVPLEFDLSGYVRSVFRAATVGKGDRSVTVEGVLAGQYLAIHGKSEAKVEVAAGRETAITMMRVESKTK